MTVKFRKFMSFLLCFLLIFEQSGLIADRQAFAQVAGHIDISGYLSGLKNALASDVFRPLHLRFLSYDPQKNDFHILLDKGSLNNPELRDVTGATRRLMEYFFIGLTLPSDAFWVNLRPDSPDNIIDPLLAKTDIGKVLLEADLQLKKDTALATSPETPEGREYWDKLYKKAGELFGSENITIPTLTRPWIVPDEIIIGEAGGSAYIYKATLKVMLEQDYLFREVGSLSTGSFGAGKDSAGYDLSDPRLKELNEYSSLLIRQIIIPKITQKVNSSRKYASLRQVYYSLIMAQWFKFRMLKNPQDNPYRALIDSKNLAGMTTQEPYSVESYFKAYQQSFKDGEYHSQVPVYTPSGQAMRSYFSGGITGIAPVDIPSAGELTVIDRESGGRITVLKAIKNIAGVENPYLLAADILEAFPESRADVLNNLVVRITGSGLPAAEVEERVKAIEEAHQVDPERQLGERNPDGTYRKHREEDKAYTWKGMLRRARILGRLFTQEQLENLIRYGIAGKSGGQAKELTIYGDASVNDWAQAILRNNRWHEGGDFRRLLGTNRVLVLGDTNHDLLGIQRALVEHLEELKEAGVTHLGLEVPSDLNVSDIDKIAQSSWIPHRFKQLVKLVEEIGLKVVFIDMPKSQIQAAWSKNQTSFERGVYMGNYVADFLSNNPEAVMTVVTGYAHIRDYNQIPAQLDNDGFQYALVPVVSEGQQDSNPFGPDVNFITLPLARAISYIAEPDKNYGYIDLAGLTFETRGATAILHFPRPKITAVAGHSSEAKETSDDGITALDVKGGLTQLAPIAENTISQSAYVDFQDRVDGNVHAWPVTNQYKIIEFVKGLKGISDGQKMYLAGMLMNYANNTGEHSLGGSIIDIGFQREGQFFEITTVDTFDYPYDPNGDYGSLKRHWEVSLRTLQEQFGFADILIKDLSEIPEISIRNNPERPLSIIKLLLLVLTAIKHPERVAILSDSYYPASLCVFNGKPGESVLIARLEFTDFMLTNSEQAFMEAAEVAHKINHRMNYLHAIFGEVLMPTGIHILKRRRINNIVDSLLETKKVANIDRLSVTKDEILKARKKLSFLDEEQSARLLAEIDDAISRTEKALGLVDKYAVANTGFVRTYGRGEQSAGTELAHARYLLFKLRKIRGRISAYTALSGSVIPDITEPAIISPVPQANLDEALAPPLRKGFARYRYFTGKASRDELSSLLTEGIDLNDFGGGGRWGVVREDFDEYMFHEYAGALGYVIFVDIPEDIVSQARAMGFPLDNNIRKLISEKVNSGDSNYTADVGKLRREFIIGAFDQRTGEWFMPEQGNDNVSSKSTPSPSQAGDRSAVDSEDYGADGNVSRQDAEVIARSADESGAKRIALPADIIRALESKFGAGRVGPVEVVVVAQPFMRAVSGRPIEGPVRMGSRIFVGDEYFAAHNNDLWRILSDLGHEAMAQRVAQTRPELTAEDAHELAKQMQDIFRVEGENAVPAETSATPMSSSLNPVPNASSDKPFSPASTQKGKRDLGGIDFRYLPVVTQAIGNLNAGMESPSVRNRLSGMNPDAEWRDIENLVNSGIIPSGERIKEYVQVSCRKSKTEINIDKVISCIADIMRMEEERDLSTAPVLRDILAVLDSAGSAQQLKAVFAGINLD